MSQWPLIGVLVLGFAGLLTYCVPHAARQIQQDIQARTLRALSDAKAAYPPDWVVVDGRDVTLTGVSGPAFDSLRDMVGRIPGVRAPVHAKMLDLLVPPPPPIPPEVTKLDADLTKFMEGKTVRFDVAAETLHPEGKLVLDQVARIMATAPTVSVEITGYTANDGDLSFNLDLSKRRAATVKQYLMAKGIKADRMTTDGFGSARPIVTNDTPENRAKNRRIEFHANSRVPGAPITTP